MTARPHAPRGLRLPLAAAGVLVVLAALVWLLWPHEPAAAELTPLSLGAASGGPSPGPSQAEPRLPGPARDVALTALAPPSQGAPTQPLLDTELQVIRGQVLDVRGRALTGARVYASGPVVRVVHGDAEGRFELELPHDSEARLRVSHVGFAGTGSLPVQAIERELAVRLTPVTQVALRVIDEYGEALADAGVLAFDTLRAHEPRERGVVDGWDPGSHTLASTWVRRVGPLGTDAEGFARLSLREGSWTLVPAWRKLDLLDTRSIADVRAPLDRGLVEVFLGAPEAHVVLTPPARSVLSGRVLPALAGARVVASFTGPGAPLPDQQRFTSTDGSFHFEGLRAGPWQVVATHGLQPLSARAWLRLGSGERRDLELSFEQQRVVATVRDTSSGGPVPGAQVWIWRQLDPEDGEAVPRPPMALSSTPPEGMRPSEQPSDAEGRCDLSQLTPGRYLLWASLADPPFTPTEARWLDVPPGEQAVRVELPVVPSAPVTLRLPDVGDWSSWTVSVRPSSARFVGAQLDPLGVDAPSGAPAWHTPALAPGTYDFEARPRGSGSGLRESGGWRRLTITLGRPNEFDLQVLEQRFR